MFGKPKDIYLHSGMFHKVVSKLDFREKMAQAYDFALEKVGLDMLSYNIYADYISFLKTVYVCLFIDKLNAF